MSIWDVLGVTANIIGILGAIAATFAWLQSQSIKAQLDNEAKRQNERIRVILYNEDNETNRIELPARIRRRDVSRAEVLGRIGMINQGKRFDIVSLNSKEFIECLDNIAVGSSNQTLKIPLTRSEYEELNQLQKNASVS